MMDENVDKYPALQLVAGTYKVLAVFVSLAAVLGSVLGAMIAYSGDDYVGFAILISSVIGCPVASINLFAMSDAITLYLQIGNDLSEVKHPGLYKGIFQNSMFSCISQENHLRAKCPSGD